MSDPDLILNPDGQIDGGITVEDRLGTSYTDNPSTIASILSLYARPGQSIADVTYGKGVFWRKAEPEAFRLLATDLATGGPDFRSLPYADESMDMIVLDPPYRYRPDARTAPAGLDENYRLTASAPKNIQGVIQLYVDGAIEAARVLRPGGFLVVKCQDTIQDGNQHWVHIELTNRLTPSPFVLKDLAVVTDQTKRVRWKVQKHLDKTHSYFLVFRKGGAWVAPRSSQSRSNDV